MKDRIRELLLSEGLTSGAFADEIGVQRSSLSHILNGRNKPSLDFVIKTKTKFPKLNLSWLIMGEGLMYPTDNELVENSPTPDIESPTIFQSYPEQTIDEEAPIDMVMPEDEEKTVDTDPSQVSQVLIFYDDMTFDSFKSRK